MSEKEREISYEETRHLFNPDQDGATCEHVWRWTYNHITNRQITRTCVVCHASSGFPADEGFLRPRYITAENANLRHYMQMKQQEQELAEARALLEEALDEMKEWLWVNRERREQTKQRMAAFLAKGEPHESV